MDAPTAKVVVRDVELKIFYALCPYCSFPHKHGYKEESDISGCSRASHCGQGEYLVEGNIDYKLINIGLRRRENAVIYKRKMRAAEKEAKAAKKEEELIDKMKAVALKDLLSKKQ